MYYSSRSEAGAILAEKLYHAYAQTDTVVLAINQGGVLVAGPIAARLAVPMRLLQIEEISLPGTGSEVVGTLDESGGFEFTGGIGESEQQNLLGEFHSHIEAQKMDKMHLMNRMTSELGTLERKHLHDKNVILVADGLKSPNYIDAAVTYLKPVRTKRIIGCAAVASIPVIDRMHILTDEIRVLSVKDNYLSTDHYFDDEPTPDEDELFKVLKKFANV